MPHEDVYQPRYENSWALIIGINGYQKVSPLRFARGDAEGVSQILQARFKFEPARITLLLDCDATRQGILQSFFSLRKEAGPDDRVLVFFAGHGHTESGRRGDVGFLVPVDGDANDLSTLIRWDELTRNGDLIDAKHVFYIMDACYGGLAVTRRLSAGSMRFLKDMLRRYSRQVLAAGKGDEVVSDGGGPKPGHSIFTGHLLTALEGDVASSGGVLAIVRYVLLSQRRAFHGAERAVFGKRERHRTGRRPAVRQCPQRRATLPARSDPRCDTTRRHPVAQSGCVCFHCRSHHGGLRRWRLARDVPVRQFGPKLAPRPRFLLGRSLYYKAIPAKRSIVPAGRWSVFQRLESPEFRAADRHRRDTRETGNASRFRCSHLHDVPAHRAARRRSWRR